MTGTSQEAEAGTATQGGAFWAGAGAGAGAGMEALQRWGGHRKGAETGLAAQPRAGSGVEARKEARPGPGAGMEAGPRARARTKKEQEQIWRYHASGDHLEAGSSQKAPGREGVGMEAWPEG